MKWWIFTESDGTTFSMRKFLAFGSGLVVFISAIAFLFGAKMLNTQYLLMFGGAWTFYFTKDYMRGKTNKIAPHA